MAKERGYRKSLYSKRETQCKAWARNPEIIKCLKSILNWSDEENSSNTDVYENVYDWVNNIIWYSNMQDIDPVFGRVRKRIKGK